MHSFASAEAIDQLAGCDDLDGEFVWVDREQIVVAADDRGGVVRRSERDEVIIVRIAAHGRVWRRGVSAQRCLRSEVGDESERFGRSEVFAEAESS